MHVLDQNCILNIIKNVISCHHQHHYKCEILSCVSWDGGLKNMMIFGLGESSASLSAINIIIIIIISANITIFQRSLFEERRTKGGDDIWTHHSRQSKSTSSTPTQISPSFIGPCVRNWGGPRRWWYMDSVSLWVSIITNGHFSRTLLWCKGWCYLEFRI